MKLKKLSMLTVLALSQIASAIPVSAQSTVTNAPQESDVSEVLEQSLTSQETGNEASISDQQGSQGEAANNNSAGTDESAPLPNAATGTEPAEVTEPPAEVIDNNTDTTEPIPAASANELILHFNSAKMEQGGQVYNAPQPMQVKKGVSYVPIRALVDRVGYKVTYDKKTKETIITSGTNELRFKTDSSKYTVNGVSKSMKGTSFQTKNTFMVPLTAITQALNISYKVDNVGKRIIMDVSVKPVAKFTIQEKEIFAGQTTLTYVTEATSPSGLEIVNERWEGRQDIYAQAGEYTITYTVQDENGTWSDPYSQKITVLQPNLPPVAMFTTDKDEYRMGEFITITDQSTDDGQIVKHDWNNKAYAHFTPGPKTISLTVTDNKGLTATYEKTIIVTGETLYSADDFNKLLLPPGEKFSFDGSNVPALPKINYSYYDEPSTLIRSNSPETVNSEGIVYKETSVGDTRFMIHHVNNVGKNVKMYVVATNKNATKATITTENLGFAGPTGIATAAGKKSVYNYFESMQNGSKQSMLTLEPGESKLVMTELSKTRMKQGDVISLFSDMHSDYPIEYNVVMIDEKLDPLTVLGELPVLDRDGVHNRGTYPNSTRVIRYSEYVGDTAQRLALGDNQDDPNLAGMDPMLGVEASNTGNFGVLYKMTFDNVAANTLISFNPRGGKYSGYAMVNGNITAIYSAGQVSAPNEQAVLYRTGDYSQKVEILMTAAPGSNLPVNLLFTPLPEKKE